MNRKIALFIGGAVIVFLAGIGACRLFSCSQSSMMPKDNLCIDCSCKDGGQFCACTNCINMKEVQMERRMFRHQKMTDCPYRTDKMPKDAEVKKFHKNNDGKPFPHFDGHKHPRKAMPLPKPEPKKEIK